MSEPKSSPSGRGPFIAGILLAIVTALGVGGYTLSLARSQRSQLFFALAPTASLGAGAKLTSKQLVTLALPESAKGLTQVAIPATADNRTWLLSRAATKDVAAGSLLLYDQFSYRDTSRLASRIEPGSRALSLPVTASSAVSYFIEPGSRVDIVGTMLTGPSVRPPAGPDDDDGGPRNQGIDQVTTKTLLQNVRVLAVGQAITAGAYLGEAREGYPTVTIEVSPQQAETLVFALTQVQDGFTLLLRNPKDSATAALPRVSWQPAGATTRPESR